MDVVENVEEADGSRQGTTVIPDKVPSGVFKINGATVEEFTQVRRGCFFLLFGSSSVKTNLNLFDRMASGRLSRP